MKFFLGKKTVEEYILYRIWNVREETKVISEEKDVIGEK